MATQWYWLENDDEKGPVSFQDLMAMIRDHTLNDDNLVRPDYATEWQRTDNVPGLLAMAERTPVASQELPTSEVIMVPSGTGEEGDAARFYLLEQVGHDAEAHPADPRNLSESQIENVHAAEIVVAAPDESEPVSAEGAMSAAIDAASAAWDQRHAVNAPEEPSQGPSEVAQKLAGPVAWILSLPWRIVLGIAFVIQRVLSPPVRFVASNRRVTQPLAIVILIGIFWWNVSAMFVTQQQVYSHLDETFTELQNLRAAKVDNESWSQFRQRSLTKLGSFVPKLEKEADVSDPASLSLLAVSRDYLPQLLNEKSRFSHETEYKISTHLEVARRSISEGTGSSVRADFWMLLFASLNAGLVLAAAWFIAKKVLFRASPAR